MKPLAIDLFAGLDNYSEDPEVQAALARGIKQGGDWFNAEQPSILRMCSSKSDSRAAASAEIAKIPLPLARYIARVFHP